MFFAAKSAATESLCGCFRFQTTILAILREGILFHVDHLAGGMTFQYLHGFVAKSVVFDELCGFWMAVRNGLDQNYGIPSLSSEAMSSRKIITGFHHFPQK